jgi:hypothetical protein
MKRDEIRGRYGKPFVSTLTGSDFAFDSLVDTVTTSNRSLALVLSQRKDGMERARGTRGRAVPAGTRIRIADAADT